MKRKNSFSYAKYGYIFSIPFALTFLIFSLYPTLFTAILGFTDAQGLGNTSWHILENPFQNFVTILNNNTFRQSLVNTVVIWITNFIPQLGIALVLTAIFTSRSRMVRGQGLFKVIFYMPNIITAATVAILFNTLFAYPKGPINDIVMSLGMIDSPVNFLLNKWTARFVVAFIQFWMWYGYTMLILISGALGISPEIYEAAAIDGASATQQFFRITIPNIKSILLYTLITSMIGGLNMFDISKLFLLGGPDNATLTTSVFVYNQAFSGSYLYNRAAAASMIMFLIIALISAILFFMMRDKEEAAQQKLEKQRLKEQKQKRKEMKERVVNG